MKVVRYTFDVCFRSNHDKDVYSTAPDLEAALLKSRGVVGCEVKDTHTLRANSVDVDKVIERQNRGEA